MNSISMGNTQPIYVTKDQHKATVKEILDKVNGKLLLANKTYASNPMLVAKFIDSANKWIAQLELIEIVSDEHYQEMLESDGF